MPQPDSTAASASAAISFIKKRGCTHIRLVNLIAAPEGIARIQKDHPDVDIYVAAEDDPHVPERAVSGLQGWIDCFEKAEFSGSLFCGGIGDMGEASSKSEELSEAYEFGKALK